MNERKQTNRAHLVFCRILKNWLWSIQTFDPEAGHHIVILSSWSSCLHQKICGSDKFCFWLIQRSAFSSKVLGHISLTKKCFSSSSTSTNSLSHLPEVTVDIDIEKCAESTSRHRNIATSEKVLFNHSTLVQCDNVGTLTKRRATTTTTKYNYNYNYNYNYSIKGIVTKTKTKDTSQVGVSI